jgi:hypothetical protein
MPMRTRLIAVAAIVLIAVAGCSKTGSGTTNTSASDAVGKSIDVCSLLTTAEASQVLGATSHDGVAGDARQCHWESASGSIAILVTTPAQWDTAVAVNKTLPTFKELSGLGEAAFSSGYDIHVLKNNTDFHIGVVGTSDNVQAAITVAQKALAKL